MMPVKFLNRILRIKEQHKEQRNTVLEGVYLMECKGLKREELLFNDGKPSIILMPNRDDKVTISVHGERKVFQSAWVTYGVLQHSYMEIPADLDYLIIIRFNGHSFFDLFGGTPQRIKNTPICNLHDFHNEEIMQHFIQSFAFKDPKERVDFLKNYLDKIQINTAFPKVLEEIVDVVKYDNTIFSVSDLSAIFKGAVHDKWIQRSFNKYFGLSPKKYLQLQRFIKVHDQLDKCQSEAKLALALDYGYYDSNHLIKDFKYITGHTPGSYLLK